jgi:hypothetical protein
MRQRRWLELIKDYKLEVNYHPRKAIVVANTLSRKAHCNHLSAIRFVTPHVSKPHDYVNHMFMRL